MAARANQEREGPLPRRGPTPWFRALAVTALAVALGTALVGCGGSQAMPGHKAKPPASKTHGRHPAASPAKKPSSKPAGGMGGGTPKKKGSRAGKGGATSPKPAKTTPATASRQASPGTSPPLPRLDRVAAWNPGLRYFHRLSRFIPGMGIHLGPPGPGLVLMTNGEGEVTAVEATFPQRLGNFPWFDPPTTEPNAGVAFHSEHLYFIAPAKIQPGMATGLPSDLGSWASLVAVNPRLNNYQPLPKTYHGLTIYGPKGGPGVMVLVRPGGAIAGFFVEEPASWGHFPWYAQPRGRPVPSRIFGRAYYSVLYVTPPPSRAR